MEMNKKRTLILAFFITLFIFLCIILLGMVLDNQRLRNVDDRFDETQRHINDIQQLLLMSEIYGEEIACTQFPNKLKEMDKTIWELGIKLDQYRTASEEFKEDKYYKLQKRLFNEQEVLYLLLLNQIKDKCNYTQSIISFFYSTPKDCAKCDDQSFVLADINRIIDTDVSIFSFDTDLGLTSITLLQNYYKVDSLPCIIIDEEKFCGIRSKDFILEQICKNNDIEICDKKRIIIS